MADTSKKAKKAAEEAAETISDKVEEAAADTEKVVDKAKDLAGKAGDVAEDVADTVSLDGFDEDDLAEAEAELDADAALADYADDAEDAVEDVADKAEDVVDDVADKAEDVVDDAEDEFAKYDIPADMSGIVALDGVRYYVQNGKVAKDFSGKLRGKDKTYVIENGAVTDVADASGAPVKEAAAAVADKAEDAVDAAEDKFAKYDIPADMSGIVALDGVKYYVKNGKVAENYTGKIQGKDKTYNIVNGAVKDVADLDAAEAVADKVADKAEDVADAAEDKFAKFAIPATLTGIVSLGGVKYYVKNGKVAENYTGKIQGKDKIYEIVNGAVKEDGADAAEAVTDKVESATDKVEEAAAPAKKKLDKGMIIALACIAALALLIIAIMANTNKKGSDEEASADETTVTTVAEAEETTTAAAAEETTTAAAAEVTYEWRDGIITAVRNGQVATDVNGVIEGVDGNWYYFVNGQVDSNFVGMAANENGTWYIHDGMVDFGYNGTVNYNGVDYNVQGGKAV